MENSRWLHEIRALISSECCEAANGSICNSLHGGKLSPSRENRPLLAVSSSASGPIRHLNKSPWVLLFCFFFFFFLMFGRFVNHKWQISCYNNSRNIIVGVKVKWLAVCEVKYGALFTRDVCSLPSLMSVHDCRGAISTSLWEVFPITAAGREEESEDDSPSPPRCSTPRSKMTFSF